MGDAMQFSGDKKNRRLSSPQSKAVREIYRFGLMISTTINETSGFFFLLTQALDLCNPSWLTFYSFSSLIVHALAPF